MRLRRPDANCADRCRCTARLRLSRPDATAWQQMEGFRPLHDEQEGRFRTASLHPPAAPNDHHHRYLLSVLPGYGVANMGCPAQICFRWHPCQLNPYAQLAVGWLAQCGW